MGEYVLLFPGILSKSKYINVFFGGFLLKMSCKSTYFTRGHEPHKPRVIKSIFFKEKNLKNCHKLWPWYYGKKKNPNLNKKNATNKMALNKKTCSLEFLCHHCLICWFMSFTNFFSKGLLSSRKNFTICSMVATTTSMVYVHTREVKTAMKINIPNGRVQEFLRHVSNKKNHRIV